MIVFDAAPIDKYSSFHKVSLLRLLGIKSKLAPHVTATFNFNLNQQRLSHIAQAQLTFNFRDMSTNSNSADFSVNNLTRWRLNIAAYPTFTDFLQTIKCSHRRKYRETQKTFAKHGGTVTYIEDDWSQHTDAVYQLYCKVAAKHGAQLYDLDFFRTIAKLNEYKLLCVWLDGMLIAALVIIDEDNVFHSMLCCLDYQHTKKIHAYSMMHYELIRLAIESKKYTMVDIGLTADKAKALMDFQPIEVCMEISARNIIIKSMLRLLSRFLTAAFNDEAKLRWSFKI